MGKSRMSAILLFALGVLVVSFAVGKSLIEWEWWTFLLVLSSLAFIVGLILFAVQRILR
jgi:uncharacterized membrane protein YcfT